MKVLGFTAIAAAVLMTGCAQKVQIKALAPAKVGEMASKKKVAIVDFKGDEKTKLSSKIEAQIAKHELDKKRYFTVLNRKDMDKVLKEQKLQASELTDEKSVVKVGKILGAQALINGDVTSSAESGHYVEDKEKCLQYYKDSGECARYRYYKVQCKTLNASVSATISIVDMEDAHVIYSDTLSKEYSGDSCKDGDKNFGLVVLDKDSVPILGKQQAITRLTDQIANEFVYKLTPHYIYFQVTLLDEIEFDVSDQQAKMLEIALENIKQGRLDKAEKILSKLSTELEGKSYVVNYDLGVVKEALGDFEAAKKLYKQADEAMLEPIPEVNAAVIRIDKLISQRDEATRQMKK